MTGLLSLGSLGDDLPEVELQAMRLDGEVFRIADAWAPVDEPVTPAMRARAVMVERSPRLAAGLRTAAWIWGATTTVPRPVELCADVRARARVRPNADAVVREVVLEDDEVALLDGVAVTTPARTIADLARMARIDDAVLRDLARLGGVETHHVHELLLRRSLPGRRAAFRTVERALGQPLLTR